MEDHMPLKQTLLPALVQCFGIMFLGYVLGKFNILGQKEARGISKFVQYLALPALIFGRISTMSFTDVKWEFVASVFVAKACIFACVVLLSMILTHPVDLAKSGIFAIATTQSNDFALAYPMFMSLYRDSHPDYPSYLYIIAPIQLLVLNTIGFFIIETEKQRYDDTGKCHVWKIFRETLKNPIVLMTITGLIWNVSFGSKVLPIFDTLLNTLSTAFPATALFLVGHTMATKSEKADSHIPITVALLIISKNLILPIFLQKISTLMLQGSDDDEIKSLSCFGFLYGTTPTAPSAYVFAVHYDVSVDIITKTIIGSTLLSAPLMFASASVISLSEIGIENMTFYLNMTIQYLSCASLLCSSWLLLSFIVGKRFQNISFQVTLYIFFAQFLTSAGGVLLFFSLPKYSAIFYIRYILSIGGIYATRICTFFLATLLLIIRWRGLCYILQVKKYINIISILCVTIPLSITIITSFSLNVQNDRHISQYNIQTILTFTLTIICFTGTVLCLILQHICFRNNSNYSTPRNSIESSYQKYEEIEPLIKNPINNDNSDEISVDVEDLGKHFDILAVDSGNLFSNKISDYMCDLHYNCGIEKRLQCAARISIYQNEQKENGLYDDKQIFQHTTLLIILSVSMTLSLTVCFWKLIMEKTDGVFVELEFLDTIVSYSLGILLLLIFGFNKGLINTISNKLKTLRHNKNIETEMSVADICYGFMTKYEKKFKKHVFNLKLTNYKYSNIFCSSDLTHWLIENGAIKSSEDAEKYIFSLQEGNVIEVVDKCSFFPENELIFRLTNTCNEIQILE